MSEKVDVVLAGRYDMASFIGAGEFAPRAAVVYKPSEKTTWRLSYNKALSGPSALQMYIDFPVAVLSPGVLDVWLSGQAGNHSFADPSAQIIDLVNLFPIDLPVGSQLPLALPYGFVAEDHGLVYLLKHQLFSHFLLHGLLHMVVQQVELEALMVMMYLNHP